MIYNIQAEGPGVAHEKKEKRSNLKKKKQFFSLCHPHDSHECPQKKSTHSGQAVWPAKREHIYNSLLSIFLN